MVEGITPEELAEMMEREDARAMRRAEILLKRHLTKRGFREVPTHENGARRLRRAAARDARKGMAPADLFAKHGPGARAVLAEHDFEEAVREFFRRGRASHALGR